MKNFNLAKLGVLTLIASGLLFSFTHTPIAIYELWSDNQSQWGFSSDPVQVYLHLFGYLATAFIGLIALLVGMKKVETNTNIS